MIILNPFADFTMQVSVVFLLCHYLVRSFYYTVDQVRHPH